MTEEEKWEKKAERAWDNRWPGQYMGKPEYISGYLSACRSMQEEIDQLKDKLESVTSFRDTFRLRIRQLEKKLYESEGKMNLSKHPILKQGYDVMQAIEECGASEKLTHAVILAGEFIGEVDKLVEHVKRLEAGIKTWHHELALSDDEFEQARIDAKLYKLIE